MLRIRTIIRATLLSITGFLCLLAMIFTCCTVNTKEQQQPGKATKTRIEADLWAGFVEPPVNYGPVPLWWWVGEPLERKRLSWQLDQMKSEGVTSACVIYHHPPGKHEKAIVGDPPLFSEKWWDLFRWVVSECKRRGMTIWFSGYVFENGVMTEIMDENPELRGSQLECINKLIEKAGPVDVPIPGPLVSAMAYRLVDKKLELSSAVDLRKHITNQSVKWNCPGGKWQVVIVHTRPDWYDTIHPDSGKKLLDQFYGKFERHIPNDLGKTFSGFFSDELWTGAQMKWSSRFAEEFHRRKGYDLVPLLPALWHDIGPKTAKIRIDYYDVIVALMEENFFRPIFDFNEKYGMLHGHDQAGRGNMRRQTSIFAECAYIDYFRTMRWYSAPGYDDYGAGPVGRRNFKDAKIASSIASLYRRERVWCEAFHSSGWGLTPAQMVAWTNENYAYGATLYDKHGLYYTTYGGWWEWAPPSAHFRQPYWLHHNELSSYVTRLSYLLSRGVHRCDVAILYPVTTLHASLGGERAFSEEAKVAEEAAWGLGHHLFTKAIDFDYIDHESVGRAEIQDRELTVAGNRYQVFVLPAVSAVRYETLEKAVAFYRNGGVVIAYGCLPQASDRTGSDDPKLDAAVKEVFGLTAKDAASTNVVTEQYSPAGGVGVFVPEGYPQVKRIIEKFINRDFAVSEDTDNVYVLHRKIDSYDVYFLFNACGQATELDAFFRVKGEPEMWDAWTGAVRSIHRFRDEGYGTRLRLRLEPCEAKVIVFGPGTGRAAVVANDLDGVSFVTVDGQGAKVTGTCRTGGEKTVTVRHSDKMFDLKGSVQDPPLPIALDGLWDFELVPTMDNRWGDFRLPAGKGLLGSEARQFRYAEETELNAEWHRPDFDDSKWPVVTYSFGPYFWKLGPIPPGMSTKELESKLLAMERIYPDVAVNVGQEKLKWSPYHFSRRWGIELDPLLLHWGTGPHGLKQRVPDEFIDLGSSEPGSTYYLWTSVRTKQARRTYLNLGATGHCWAWINGRNVLSRTGRQAVSLKTGNNPMLVKFVRAEKGPLLNYSQQRVGLRGYVVLGDMSNKTASLDDDVAAKRLGLRWFDKPGTVPYDIRPKRARHAGWYRFTAPPGLRTMKFVAHGKLEVWVNGQKASIRVGRRRPDGTRHFKVSVKTPPATTAVVAIRIEQEPGIYAGAAIPEPIALDCGQGQAPLGEWSNIGLATYSGAAWYRRNVKLTDEHISKQVILDLGSVAVTAEVRVNGQAAGVRIAPPWRFDITKLVRTGANKIEVLVTNTLANHYSIGIPTLYVHKNQTLSGLLGPVRINFLSQVELRGEYPL